MIGEKFWNFVEPYNVMELYVFLKRTSYIGLQATISQRQ